MSRNTVGHTFRIPLVIIQALLTISDPSALAQAIICFVHLLTGPLRPPLPASLNHEESGFVTSLVH